MKKISLISFLLMFSFFSFAEENNEYEIYCEESSHELIFQTEEGEKKVLASFKDYEIQYCEYNKEQLLSVLNDLELSGKKFSMVKCNNGSLQFIAPKNLEQKKSEGCEVIKQ